MNSMHVLRTVHLKWLTVWRFHGFMIKSTVHALAPPYGSTLKIHGSTSYSPNWALPSVAVMTMIMNCPGALRLILTSMHAVTVPASSFTKCEPRENPMPPAACVVDSRTSVLTTHHSACTIAAMVNHIFPAHREQSLHTSNTVDQLFKYVWVNQNPSSSAKL